MGNLQLQSSMRTQFLLMMIGASLITMLCMGIIFIKSSLDADEEQVAEYRKTLIEDVERELKIETETAISVIDTVYKKQQAGQLTEEQAKAEAAALIRAMRYDNGAGYFWIDTYEGVNVVLLGRTETEGKSRINLTDPTGKAFIREMIENGQKSGGGYTDLMFAKPNQTEPLPKRNYTASFAPYRWIVGTGIWVDYIDNKIAEMQEKADAAFYSHVMMIGIVMVVLIILLMFASTLISRRMINPIRDLTEAVNVLATGDFRMSNNAIPIDTERDDEIGVIGRAILNLRKLIPQYLFS